jgi:dienelactone hydrolase
VPELPDPFQRGKGRVGTPAEWRRQREALREVLLRQEYGHAPPPPSRVAGAEIAREPIDGTLEKIQVRLTTGPAPRLTLWLGLVRPAGDGPFPTVLHLDHRGPFAASQAAEVARRGYLFVGHDPTFLDPDEPGAVGPAQAAYPGRDWATLAVWAWGASRAIDYLVTRRDVDRARIIITGHSRSGKAALLAGALDERAALVAPQCSGTGGAASYRVRGAGAESLAQITRNFPHWFQPSLSRFAGQEDRLPFDQHFLLALCAPRALLVLEALGDRWANTDGTQEAIAGARPVYAFLGASDRLGFSFRPGGHDQSDEDWRALLDFADQVLLGKPAAPGRRFDRLPAPGRRPAFRWSAPGAAPRQ